MKHASDRPIITALGLGVLRRRGIVSLALAMAVGLAFGAYMALADRYLFASAVPAAQADMVASLTAPQRILPNAIRAAIDEVVYRLVIMTALVWSIATINGAIRGWCYWAAIVAVAFVAYPYLASLPARWHFTDWLELFGGIFIGVTDYWPRLRVMSLRTSVFSLLQVSERLHRMAADNVISLRDPGAPVIW